MRHRVVLLAASSLTVALGACTGGRDSAPPLAPASTSTAHTTPTTVVTTPITTTTSPPATVAGPSLITAPTTEAPVPVRERPDTTIRVGVSAAEGGDGLGDDDGPTSRYPPFTAIDISPLPPAITDDQGRNDPGAVARQWAGLKVLTAQIMDGPLWPYSVGRHLPALSEPTGQFITNGRLQRVDVLDMSQPDDQTALATVAVDADNPAGDTLHIVYAIELWRSDDGHWLVAFADPTTR